MSGVRESGATAGGPPSGRAPARRRVVVAIDNAVRATPLVLVSAPTGYGKSVALGAWAHRRGDVGWVPARAGADTAAVLAAGIDAAARAAGVVDPDADFADAALGGPPSASELISRLARLLQDVPRPLTLVIDDAHLLDSAVLVATVCSDPVLATGLLRMVLVGNLRLGPVYARHLASGTATLIGPDVLALTPAEVAVAVRSDVDTAYADTEGWPLAVGYRSPDRRAAAGLTLTDRVDDLLWAVRPELRAFVLDAVVLPTLDETLVRRVAGIEGAAALLEEAAESALPLTRFYDAADRVRYRWHPVFAVHCLRIAERADPARVRKLRLAAAAETADADPLTAAELTVRAGDVDGAASLVQRSWLRILTTGDVHALEAVCRSLPAHMQESPEILRIVACCRTVFGDEEGAAELLRRARRPGTGAGRGRPSAVELFTDLFLENDPAAGERLVAAAEERLSDPRGSLDRPHALYLAGRSELLLSPWAPRARWLLQAAARRPRRGACPSWRDMRG